MNAALVLMASTWLAGADTPAEKLEKPATTTPAVTVAPVADCGCDCCHKESLFDRLRGMFPRKHDCCEPCGCAPVCETCHPVKVYHHADCGCDPCAKPSLFDRLRANFRKHDDCCDTCGAMVVQPLKAADEKLDKPKEGDKKKDGDKSKEGDKKTGETSQPLPQAPQGLEPQQISPVSGSEKEVKNPF